jgi:hypothetical protein
LAAAAFAAVAGWGRHRLGGHRPDRHCCCDRNEDQNIRRSPSRSGAGAGGVAEAPPATMEPARRRAGPLCRSRRRSSALGARRACCLARAARSDDAACGGRAQCVIAGTAGCRPSVGLTGSREDARVVWGRASRRSSRQCRLARDNASRAGSADAGRRLLFSVGLLWTSASGQYRRSRAFSGQLLALAVACSPDSETGLRRCALLPWPMVGQRPVSTALSEGGLFGECEAGVRSPPGLSWCERVLWHRPRWYCGGVPGLLSLLGLGVHADSE